MKLKTLKWLHLRLYGNMRQKLPRIKNIISAMLGLASTKLFLLVLWLFKNHLKGHDGVKLTEEEEGNNKKEEDNSKNKTKLANKELLYFIVSGFLPFRKVDNFHLQRF